MVVQQPSSWVWATEGPLDAIGEARLQMDWDLFVTNSLKERPHFPFYGKPELPCFVVAVATQRIACNATTGPSHLHAVATRYPGDLIGLLPVESLFTHELGLAALQLTVASTTSCHTELNN